MMMKMQLIVFGLRGLLNLLLLLILLHLFIVILHIKLDDRIEFILLVLKLGVPVVLDLAIRATGHHLRDFGPLILIVLILL